VAKPGTILLVNADGHRQRGQALFRDLGLAAGGTVTMSVGVDKARFVYRLRRADGRTVGPYAIWLQRW
jgi:hypothetical protein